MESTTQLSRFFLEWKKWWATLSAASKFLPIVLVSIYVCFLVAMGGLRSDHVVIFSLLLALCYGGPFARVLLGYFLPFLLTGIIYDSQRYYSDYIRGPIHVKEPYLFDKTFFGISTPFGVLTPNEFWQHHIHPVLDVITGFAYLVFFGAFMSIAAYFIFYVARKGTRAMSSARMKQVAPRMTWAFFWLNMLGYSTYYWFAAAPPWYVEQYGLGPARMDVQASSAGCIRFDQIVGTHFFSGFYGRAADVFGAIPSLHISYPLLAVLFAFQFGRLRIFCLCFYALMCFSAVYLNHHYVLDILWGSTYTFFIYWIVNWVGDRRTGIAA
jgi:membrane-associated phospholipid phosphatase